MILECDIGNSRCKWRLIDDGLVVDRGVVDCEQTLFDSSFPENPVQRIRVASVAFAGVNELVSAYLQQRYGVDVEWAVSEARCAGVSCAYRQPETLGVDRWLVAVAAYNIKSSAVVVVDVGSALTVDVVNADGLHLGGYIIPGERLMMKTLQLDTGKVRFDDARRQVGVDFGVDTASAVGAGVHAALMGAVMVAVNRAEQLLDGKYSVLITGGGAEAIAADLSISSEIYPELVLDGLQWALP